MLNPLDRQIIAEIHTHGLSLNEVWRTYQKLTKRPLIGLADAIGEFLKEKTNAGTGKLYVASLRQDLNQWCRHVGPLEVLRETPTFVPTPFLSRFNPSTAATKRQRINTFFQWAIRKGYLESNPCDRLEPIRLHHDCPVIFSNYEVKSLIDSTPGDLRAFLWVVLGLGVRISEAKQLTWDDFVDDSLVISEKIAKGASRRVIEIPKCMYPRPEKVGSLVPLNIKRRLKAWRDGSGINPWPRNACRHTAATHLLNVENSIEKVGLILGSGPRMIHRHYKGLATKSDSIEFYRLLGER